MCYVFSASMRTSAQSGTASLNTGASAPEQVKFEQPPQADIPQDAPDQFISYSSPPRPAKTPGAPPQTAVSGNAKPAEGIQTGITGFIQELDALASTPENQAELTKGLLSFASNFLAQTQEIAQSTGLFEGLYLFAGVVQQTATETEQSAAETQAQERRVQRLSEKIDQTETELTDQEADLQMLEDIESSSADDQLRVPVSYQSRWQDLLEENGVQETASTSAQPASKVYLYRNQPFSEPGSLLAFLRQRVRQKRSRLKTLLADFKQQLGSAKEGLAASIQKTFGLRQKMLKQQTELEQQREQANQQANQTLKQMEALKHDPRFWNALSAEEKAEFEARIQQLKDRQAQSNQKIEALNQHVQRVALNTQLTLAKAQQTLQRATALLQALSKQLAAFELERKQKSGAALQTAPERFAQASSLAQELHPAALSQAQVSDPEADLFGQPDLVLLAAEQQSEQDRLFNAFWSERLQAASRHHLEALQAFDRRRQEQARDLTDAA